MSTKYQMIYYLYTLVDITETKLYHGNDILGKCQQQNFQTVIQTIGLCGNVYYNESPIKIPSSKFKNHHECWYFEWTMEIPDLFKRDDDPIAILPELFNFVPYIPNLTENINNEHPFFKPADNIIFGYRKSMIDKDI